VIAVGSDASGTAVSVIDPSAGSRRPTIEADRNVNHTPPSGATATPFGVPGGTGYETRSPGAAITEGAIASRDAVVTATDHLRVRRAKRGGVATML
jgi:hypothetical protein